MVSVQALANTILRMGEQDGTKISPMKLQKLMYYVCVEYAQNTGRNLIAEHFCVWMYGPVLPSVYDEFHSYGSEPIRSYAKNANGKSYALMEETPENVYGIIKDVWNRFSPFSAIELSRRTHLKGSGWSRAFERKSELISLDDMINDTTLTL